MYKNPLKFNNTETIPKKWAEDQKDTSSGICGKEGIDRESSKTILYDIMMNICHYTLIKMHRMYTTKSET